MQVKAIVTRRLVIPALACNGHHSIRVTACGLANVVDTVMAVTGKKDPNLAAQTIRNIRKDVFCPSRFEIRDTGGSGGYATKLLPLEDLIEFIMVLPGNAAKRARLHFAEIITRYLRGDASMCQEIAHNRQIGIARSCERALNRALLEGQAQQQAPEIGFVYATESEAFPGLIKIGRSMNVHARISSLNSGCAPAPHRLVAQAPTLHPARDEGMAHLFFADRRVEGEFFRVGAGEVLDYFANHIAAQCQRDLAGGAGCMPPFMDA